MDIYPTDQILYYVVHPNKPSILTKSGWIPNSHRADIKPLKYAMSSWGPAAKLGPDNKVKLVPAFQDKGYALFPDDRSSAFSFEARSPAKGNNIQLVMGTALRADKAVITAEGYIKSYARVEFHYKLDSSIADSYNPWKLGYRGGRSFSTSWALQYDALRVPGPRPRDCVRFQQDTLYEFTLTRYPDDSIDTLKGDMMLAMIHVNWLYSCGCEVKQLMATGCQCGGA